MSTNEKKMYDVFKPIEAEQEKIKVQKSVKKLTDIMEIRKYLFKEIGKYFLSKTNLDIYVSFMDGNPQLWQFLYQLSLGEIPLPKQYKTYLDLLNVVEYVRTGKALDNHIHNTGNGTGGYPQELSYTFIDAKGKQHIFSVKNMIYVNFANIVLKDQVPFFQALQSDEQMTPYLKKLRQVNKKSGAYGLEIPVIKGVIRNNDRFIGN